MMEEEVAEGVKQSMENLKKIFECDICTNHLVTPTQIKCGHIFCAPCIIMLQQSSSKQTRSSCPTCNAKVLGGTLLVRPDVEDLINTLVMKFLPNVESEIPKKFMGPGLTKNGSVDDYNSDRSSSDSDSERCPPPATKINELLKKPGLAKKRTKGFVDDNSDSDKCPSPPATKINELSKPVLTQKKTKGSFDDNSDSDKCPSPPATKINEIFQPVLTQKKTKGFVDDDSDSDECPPQPAKKVNELSKPGLTKKKTKGFVDDDSDSDKCPSPPAKEVNEIFQPVLTQKKTKGYLPQPVKKVNELSKPVLTKKKNLFDDDSESDKCPSPPAKKICQSRRNSAGNKFNQNPVKSPLQQQDQPLDLRTRVQNPETFTPARQYRTALVFVKALDLSMKSKNAEKVIQNKKVEPPVSEPVTPNNKSVPSNPENAAVVLDHETQFPSDPAFGLIEDMELETSPIKRIDNKENNDDDDDYFITSTQISPNTSVNPRRLVFEDEPADIFMDDQSQRNFEVAVDIVEQLNEGMAACDDRMTSQEKSSSPPDLNPANKDILLISDDEDEFLEDSDPGEGELSPKKPKVDKSHGIYKKMEATPKSTAVGLDDSVSDLFKDYWSQEDKKPSGEAKEKSAAVDVTEEDMFSEDEIPASPILPLSKPKRSPPLILPTPRKFVFCPTRLTKSQLSKLNELCQMCNGTIVKEYGEEMTHLIINLENNRVPQTMKYLFAIADKKWIVTYDWVEASIKNGEVAPEEPYETSSFPECDSGVRKSRVTLTSLFTGINFYFAGPLKSSGASIEDCKKLMGKLGGRVIDSPYAEDRNVMIIGDPLTMKSSYQEWYRTKGWITVSWEWILDCILTYNVIPFAKTHLITELDSAGLTHAALPDALLSLYTL